MPHYRLMLAVALRFLRNQDAAEDAVQDVAEVLWLQREKLKEYRSAQGLCVTAVRNRCISILRHEKSTLHGDEWVHDTMAEEQTDSQLKESRMMQFLKELHEPASRVMMLSVKGYTSEEIAEMIGKNPGAVRQIISRARKELRKKFEEDI